MSYTGSDQCSMQTWINHRRHTASIHTSYCIPLHLHFLHLIKIFKISFLQHANWRERAGYRTVSKLSDICSTLVDVAIWCKFLAKSGDTWWAYVIHHSDNMNNRYPEIQRPCSVWMQMLVHRNHILAVNMNCIQFEYCSWPFNDC